MVGGFIQKEVDFGPYVLAVKFVVFIRRNIAMTFSRGGAYG